MKKILLLLLIIVMCFTSVAQADSSVTSSDVTGSDTGHLLLGDVDHSGRINAPDALWVLQYAVGKRTLDGNQLLAADVSGQGTPSAVDALYILQKAVAKIRHFPVEQTPVDYLQQPYRKGRYDWNITTGYVYNAAYIQDYETFVLYEDQYVNHGVDNEGNIVNRIVYEESYFDHHSLLVFFGLPKLSGPPHTEVVNIYHAGKELCVTAQAVKETGGMYTADAYHKLYVVELEKQYDVENIHFFVEYRKVYEGTDGSSELLEQDFAQYDFPV